MSTYRNSLIKLTPSMLTFLWDDCRRCFWLYAQGLQRPHLPFPSVFERYHGALSRYCLGKCPSELEATLPTGRFVGGELWVKSRPLEISGRRARFFIRGRLDHLAQFDDGTWGIVDFKMVTPRRDFVAKYARQLHAYTWALERAARNGLHRTPISRLGLYCMDPVSAKPEDGRLCAELETKWVEIERDDAAFERFLGQVLDLLLQPTPPPPAADCSCCRYWKRRSHLEARYDLDGRPN